MAAHSAIPDISNDRLHVRDLAPGLAGAARIVGAASLLVALLLSLASGLESFFRGYVVGFMFTLSVAIGAILFVITQHATKAGWSVTVRRIAENFMMGFGVLAILALVIVLPIVFGLDAIQRVYPWTDPAVVAHDPVLQGKSGYLNVPFLVIRMVAYFAIWIWLSRFFYYTSTRQDQSGNPQLTLAMQARSYPAVLLMFITLTFVAIDLMMSLDPHWFSTIFGVYYFAGAALAFFAVLAIAMFALQSAGRLERSLTDEHYHDVGKLVFAWVIFWAYIAYSQYMLIWYANLPEETSFYFVRQQSPWLGLSLLLLFGHFFVPFLALISRVPKRRKQILLVGAGWVLVMHWCDILWLVGPHAVHHAEPPADPAAAFRPAPFGVLDLAQALLCTVGVGGIYLAAVFRHMGQHALVPERDPRLNESLAFENM